MQLELAQIVILIDGKPNLVRVPEDRKELALGLLAGVFDDGRILVTPLPDAQLVPIGQLTADTKKPL